MAFDADRKSGTGNKELITVNESQLMRFIDELDGMENAVSHVSGLKSQIQRLKTETNLAVSRPKIKKLYEELDKYQFQKDYVCVVLDSSNDYRRLCQNGFQINGIRYRRLPGTTGGIKSNTIVFVNELLLPELKRRLNNGRNLTKPFTPAKLEAYNALICSSSVPVSRPKREALSVRHPCQTESSLCRTASHIFKRRLLNSAIPDRMSQS